MLQYINIIYTEVYPTKGEYPTCTVLLIGLWHLLYKLHYNTLLISH